MLVIAVLLHQPLLNHGDFLARIVVRSRRRGHQAQHVAALFEQVLLYRFAHPRVACKAELFAGLEGDHGFTNHLLPERLLSGFGNLDLLFHGPQEPLVRRPVLARHRIGDLPLVE